MGSSTNPATRREFEVAGLHIAAAGVGDPHIDRDRYDIAGPASPAASLAFTRPQVLDALAADGYQLLLAGHTRQAAVPAVVQGAGHNCGLDRSRTKAPLGCKHALHVSAGIGPFAVCSVRFCCRPRGSLLTLIATQWAGAIQLTGPCSRQCRCVERRGLSRSQPIPELDGQRDRLIRRTPAVAPTPACAPLPAAWCADVDDRLYPQDETTHITGSLKHRWHVRCSSALCNGWINGDTTVVEASSGSTAVSEAYFAALLGLPFIAVMPAATSSQIALIRSQVAVVISSRIPSQVYAEAERVAKASGHYLRTVHQRPGAAQ